MTGAMLGTGWSQGYRPEQRPDRAGARWVRGQEALALGGSPEARPSLTLLVRAGEPSAGARHRKQVTGDTRMCPEISPKQSTKVPWLRLQARA